MDLQKFNRFLPHKIQKEMCESQRSKELVSKSRNIEDYWETDLISEEGCHKHRYTHRKPNT